MKKLLAALAAVVALSAAARARRHEYQDDPWAEDDKEWECSSRRELQPSPMRTPFTKLGVHPVPRHQREDEGRLGQDIRCEAHRDQWHALPAI